MTVNELIKRLEFLKDQIGGECEVQVLDVEGEVGFGIRYEAIDDPASETGAGNKVYLDITMTPE